MDSRTSRQATGLNRTARLEAPALVAGTASAGRGRRAVAGAAGEAAAARAAPAEAAAGLSMGLLLAPWSRGPLCSWYRGLGPRVPTERRAVARPVVV